MTQLKSKYSYVVVMICVIFASACEYRVVRDPDMLVRYFGSEPSSLNPITATDAYQSQANSLVMETLLDTDNVDIERRIPKLAERWDEAPDHMSYTFYLRKDVRWHDGQPFTAADVLFSFNRINDPKVGAGHLLSYFRKAGIVKATAIDDYTVRFDLDRAYVFALETIGWMPIVAKHIFDVETPFRKNPANRQPVGTGPMKFHEWTSGRHLKLLRNDNYWGKPMAFQGVTYRIIPEQGVAFQAMKKGQIDYTGVREIQWSRQTSAPKFLKRFVKATYTPVTSGYNYLGWNLRRPKLQDRRVRQALTMLTPRAGMLKALLFDLGNICVGPFYAGGKQRSPNVTPWPYDPERAKALLDAAGWKDSDGDGVRDRNGEQLALTLVYPGPSRLADAITNIIREDYRKAGVALEVQLMEWTVFLKTINDKKYDAYMGGWSGGGYESDPHQVWHSEQVDQGSNYVSFVNAEADRLIDAARQEFDVEKRTAMYNQLHEILHEEQPYTFLFVRQALVVRHHRFTNATVYANGYDLSEWGVGPSEELVQ